MSSIVVVGANWGDEGKGRIVDFLAEQASASIRFKVVTTQVTPWLTTWARLSYTSFQVAYSTQTVWQF